MAKKSRQKNALVFGATGGIGKAIVKKLLAVNINPYLIGRSTQKIELIRKEHQLQSSQTFCVQSITSEEDFEKTATWLDQRTVSFDFGIHAGGTGLFKNAEKLEFSEWRDIMDINLNSAFAFFKLFNKVRSKQMFDLVYFSSASVDQVWSKNSLYGASKAGLEMFAGCLQKEVQKDGGRVWLYKPGSVDTSFFDRVKNHIPREKMIRPELLASIVINNLFLDRNIYFKSIPIHSE